MRRAQPWQTNRARALRSRSTSAEARLWSRLRSRQFGGLKFLRQAPVGCRERRIVVEVDGGTHSADAEMVRDAARSVALRRLGDRVFRTNNLDIYEDIDRVIDGLLLFVEGETR